jgi:hypothetical protein
MRNLKPPVSLLSVLLGFVLGLSACGANFQHAECKRTYDDCVNTCAHRCQDDRLPVDGTDEGATVNTWNSECTDCESRCRSLAERCDERQQRAL